MPYVRPANSIGYSVGLSVCRSTILQNFEWTFSVTQQINGEKMNLRVGDPTNTIVLTENRTGVTLIMDLMLYQLGHASSKLRHI